MVWTKTIAVPAFCTKAQSLSHIICLTRTGANHTALPSCQSSQDSVSSHRFSPEVEMALAGVQFIAQHIRNNDKDNEVMEDWKYIAMVLDRLFLLLFTLTCFAGSGGIILRAPSLYDMREPIDAKYTTIGVWLDADADNNPMWDEEVIKDPKEAGY